jgi:hypothetical protein
MANVLVAGSELSAHRLAFRRYEQRLSANLRIYLDRACSLVERRKKHLHSLRIIRYPFTSSPTDHGVLVTACANERSERFPADVPRLRALLFRRRSAQQAVGLVMLASKNLHTKGLMQRTNGLPINRTRRNSLAPDCLLRSNKHCSILPVNVAAVGALSIALEATEERVHEALFRVQQLSRRRRILQNLPEGSQRSPLNRIILNCLWMR